MPEKADNLQSGARLFGAWTNSGLEGVQPTFFLGWRKRTPGTIFSVLLEIVTFEVVRVVRFGQFWVFRFVQIFPEPARFGLISRV